MASKKRIEYNSLPDNYVNGRILTKDDLNAIVGLLRAGVNANFDEIRKVITGTDTAVVKNLDSQRPTENNQVGDVVYVVNYEGESSINAHTGIKMYEWSGTEWFLKDTLSLKTLYDKVVNKLDTVSTTAQTVTSKVTFTGADGIVVNQLQLPAENGKFVKIQYTEQANDNRYHVIEAVMPDGRILQLNEEIQATVKNAYGSPVLDGEVGIISGSAGNIMTAILANPSNPTHALRTIGVFTQNLAVGAIGKVTNFGFVSDVPLANLQQGTGLTYAVNQPLWVSTSGKLTNVKPAKPTSQIEMGIIVRITGSAADIFVYPRVMPRILDLSDVDDSTKADKRVLEYVDLGFGAGYTQYTDRLTDLETTVSGLEQAVFISEVVTELPATGIEHHIYFVKETNPLGESLYKEWMWIDDAWELMGTSEEIIANEDADPFANVTITRSDSINLTAGADMYLVATGTNNLYGSIVNIRPTTGASIYLTNETASSTMWQDENEWYVATTTKPYNPTTGNSNAISLDLTKAEMSYDGPSADKNRVTVASDRIELEAPTIYINGNIVQDGAAYETHAEKVYTKNDFIILRDGAVTGISSTQYTGLIAKLTDPLNNDSGLVFNGYGIARVGDITYNAGVPDFSATQALATRQDSPTANGVAYWNDTNKRFDTNSTVIMNPAATGNVPLTINALSGHNTNLAQWAINNNLLTFIANNGFLGTPGLFNTAGFNNSYIQPTSTGTLVTRNINDSNPALIVNEQQGTGDILRLQYGGANKLEVTKDGFINQNGTRFITNYGTENTFVGSGSGNITMTGQYNTSLGVATLSANTTGNFNTAIGVNSLSLNTIGSSNTSIGVLTLRSNVSGKNGIAIGYESQRYVNDTTTAWTNYNTSVGYQALRGSTTPANNTGNINTAIGYQAMLNNTSGGGNSAIGESSLLENTTGSSNIAIGNSALRSSTSGSQSVAIGVNTLYSNTTGNNNSAIGFSSLYANTTGYNNTALGYYAGRFIANGSTPNATSNTSVYLGADTKALASGDTNEIVIGYNATGNGSNTVTLGNDSITKTVLKGTVQVGGNLQVDGDIIATKSAVDYTETYSNTISSTYADIVPYKDGTPLITEISGRTMPVVTQLVTNGGFDSGTTGWSASASTISATGGILSITGDGTNASALAVQNTTQKRTGQKVYSYIKARVTNAVATSLKLTVGSDEVSQASPAINTWYYLSKVSTMVNDNVDIYVNPNHNYADAATASGKVMEVDYIYLFNVSTLISNKTYSPLYNKTFDLMSDAEIKLQMDEWVQTNQVPTTVVQHAENTTIKATGKNLFDYDDYTSITSGLTINQLSDNIIQFTSTSGYKELVYIVSAKPSTTYTLSFASRNSGYTVRLYDINNVLISIPVNQDNTGTVLSSTFTTSANTMYIEVGLFNALGSAMTSTYTNMQLEQGSTATTYAPYKSETQVFTHGRLSRLPNNVSDKIRYDNGKYVLDRYVQEYTLQASDITSIVTSSTGVDYVTTKTFADSNLDNASDTHFFVSGWNRVSQNNVSYDTAVYAGYIVRPNSTAFRFLVVKGTYANLAAAQTALAGTKIWYQLATPLLATQTIDVDGSLVQDSVTTLEQTQTLATEYDVKFAINAEQTVVNLVDRDKLQQEVIDANEQKLEPITNSSGNLSVTGTTTLTSTVTTNLTVNTGGTLLASDSSNGDYTVSALSNYKYIEVRASIDAYRYVSTKLPRTYFFYDSGVPVASGGITLMVTGKPGGLAYDSAIFTVRANNAGLTSITIDADMSNYDIGWEVYGWNY